MNDVDVIAQCHCSMSLRNGIYVVHCSWTIWNLHVEHLGPPLYRCGRCTSAIMQRALPRPIPSKTGNGDSTISVNVWMPSRCSGRSARHAEVEMTRTLRSLFV